MKRYCVVIILLFPCFFPAATYSYPVVPSKKVSPKTAGNHTLSIQALVPDDQLNLYGVVKLFSVNGPLYKAIRFQYGVANFTNLPQDQYVVQIVPDESLISSVFPTYYGNALFHTASEVLFIRSDTSIQITMIQGGPPANNTQTDFVGTIGGQLIVEEANGYNTHNDRYLKHTPVYLMGPNNKAVGVSLTDDNGLFRFEGTAPGDYHIALDMVGTELSKNTLKLNFDRSDGSFLQVKVSPAGDRLVLVSSDENAIPYNERSLDDLQLFPNPVRHILYFTGLENQHMTVSVLDVEGKKVIDRRQLTSNTHSLNVDQLTNGIYFVHIDTGSAHKVFKIVKR